MGEEVAPRKHFIQSHYDKAAPGHLATDCQRL